MMVSQLSNAKTDQHDDPSAEQETDYLQRPVCPTVHFSYGHEVDRGFSVDDLERVASIDNEQREQQRSADCEQSILLKHHAPPYGWLRRACSGHALQQSTCQYIQLEARPVYLLIC